MLQTRQPQKCDPAQSQIGDFIMTYERYIFQDCFANFECVHYYQVFFLKLNHSCSLWSQPLKSSMQYLIPS